MKTKELLFPLPTEQALLEITDLLGGTLPSKSLLEQYRPHHEWFLRQDALSGIHGIGHAARVLIWQEVLSRVLVAKGFTIKQEALRWAAVTHDTQRVEDGPDPYHGIRAGRWVAKALSGTVPNDTLKVVAYLNAFHLGSEHLVSKQTPILALFKDADGLDRVRFRGLDLNYLRYKSSVRLLVNPANELFQRSHKLQKGYRAESFDSTLEEAISLGIVKNG